MEETISHSLLKEFNSIISSSYGLSFDEFLLMPLQEKICERMNILDIKYSEEYLNLIKVSKKEVTNLVELLTINVTSFFRTPKHFKLLRESFLPKIQAQSSKKKLRVWSAGCANGAEPYSLAMEILDFFGMEHRLWDIKILASDISWSSLLVAKNGIYKNNFLKHIPIAYQNKYITQNQDTFCINDDIKKLITWDYHNLLYDNGKEGFDIIFCRNVLYYFQQNAQETSLNHFYTKLKPHSPLILGASEYVAVSFTELFESKKINGIYYYEKK